MAYKIKTKKKKGLSYEGKKYTSEELDKMESELFKRNTSNERMKIIKKILTKERGWR